MKYFFPAIFFLLVQSAGAQQTKFTTSVNKTKILIGQPFEWSLKAFVSGSSATWPKIDSIPHFEVLYSSKLDSQLNNGTLILNQTITLTSWDSGRYELPSITFAGAKKTPPVLISVSYAPFDTTQDYNDIKDILDGAKASRPQWHWYLIGALLLVGLFILLFPGKKEKKPTGFVPDANSYKTALAKLQALQKAPPVDVKVLVTEAVDIFRTYLSKRKGIQSYSKTTRDLALQLQALPLPPDRYASLTQTLAETDLVKFAQLQPRAHEVMLYIETLKQSIIAIESLK